MSVAVASRYAVRSLRRNLRRSVLSVVGIAFGAGLGVMAFSWIRGEETMSVSAAAAGGIGHLRLAPEGWNESRDISLRLTDWEAELAAIRATDGVSVASPRARARGLLGLGTRSAHMELTGVDARTEQQALRYVREIPEGRYLEPDERGAVVLGRTVMRRLGAELDDELVVTVVDDEGEMQSMLLVIVGIAETGSRAIDDTIGHVALADIEALTGREGAAEITILLDDVYAVETMKTTLAAHAAGTDEMLTWMDVSPELRANLESDGAFFNMAVAIVLLVVLLGVASAQLTGVLERRKEFAVLAAVGMRARQLVGVVLIEGVVLGLLSGMLALLWAGAWSYRMNKNGIDLASQLSEEGYAFGGVLMDPMFYPDFGLWVVPTAFVLSMVATVLASLYPAWYASRTDPAAALRVDR